MFFLIGVIVILFLTVGCSSSKINTRSDIEPARHNQAQKAVSSSRSINPEDENRYKKALGMMQAGDYQQAYDLFKQVADDNPDISGPFINMGIISLKQDNNLQAESHFQQAIRLKSDNAEVYNYLGIAYRQQGRFSDANIAYKKALNLDDTMAKTYLNIGILNDLYLGDYLEAQKNYKKYQELNPDNKKVNAWLQDLNSRIQASAE